MSFRVPRRLGRLLLVPLATALLTSVLVALPQPTAEARPKLTVSILASGLSHPWDVTWVGSLMLFTERGGTVWSKRGGAEARVVKTPLTDLFASGEGGLMGTVADPAAGTNKRFYVCYASHYNGRPQDVRVVRMRLTSDTTAVRDGSSPVVVKGIPISTGRHSGCRLRFGSDGMLYVGTGDAAVSGNPQNRQSLGGKVLRVRGDGSIPTDNPFHGQGGNARYVYTYGHRNLQGLAFRPGTRELWSAEHGSDRDDEVNLITAGANYGWDPGPGYNESVPMTDLDKFPSARPAKWRSGSPTVATGGLTFLADSGWGRWQGALAVALLKGRGIRVLYLDPQTEVLTGFDTVGEVSPYGRIRTVQYGPDRALYFTSSNGNGNDVVGKLSVSATPPRLKEGTDISPVAASGVRTDGDLYAFIRTTDNRVEYKRSTDDGASWPSGWTNTRLTSASAPSVASSATGRVDIVTRNANRTITHTWLVDGIRRGQTNLGGAAINATISSLGNGTLDVFALRVDGEAYRKHYNGRSWSGWQKLSGPRFTSRIGASAQPSTGSTLITARGTGGVIYERNLTSTGNGAKWTRATGLLWSGRALGDRYPNQPLIGVSQSYDGLAVWRRGLLVLALEQAVHSEPDVVTRPNGTWVMFARNSTGGLLMYDGRPGAYTARNLGGVVR
ncbi:MAG TPA: PQQ-dependent sugar dehydrogenase [Propionibacteriaceae bacterium]|nr:PQQ-dependent sugar dehydrogenase [Propionibacteriaceae bacterium]